MVVGLIMLAGLFIYLIISIMLIFFGASIAREQGKPGWKGGLFMALIMYLILFWDWIPMRATHQYLCMTQGGFTLNKTLDEWKQEHYGVAETLIPNEEPGSTTQDNIRRYILNQRFVWEIHTSQRLFGIREHDERIVDLETEEVMAQYIDFDSKLNQHEPKSLRDFKFWMHVNSCETSEGRRTRPNKYSFNRFKTLIKFQYQKEY